MLVFFCVQVVQTNKNESNWRKKKKQLSNVDKQKKKKQLSTANKQKICRLAMKAKNLN
jgi:hypothetical protein